jgi:hypothetical protein
LGKRVYVIAGCLGFALLAPWLARAAEVPPREMLKMMELLRQWDVINNLEVLRQIETLDRREEPARPPSAQEPRPSEAKRGQK